MSEVTAQSGAVDFADELHEALQDQRVPLAAPVQARVDRILAARDAYAEARLSWEHRAETLPGSVAVSIGIVRGP